MDHIGWIVLIICFLAGGALFFSVNAVALRIFSWFKLQEAFKEIKKQDMANRIALIREKLVMTCSLYRFVFNMFILLLLLAAFAEWRDGRPEFIDYLVTFIIATLIFSVFSLAIPHALAKYVGEKILSRTYRLLLLFSATIAPVLYILKLYDGFVRRLVGVVESSPEEKQEEKQEEFLTGLEQRRIEGVVDEEEQEMIENVLELSETCADEIMTPRTDIVAVEVNSNLQRVLKTIADAGHTRVPVYEKTIDNIIGFVYAKDLLTEIGKNPDEFNLREKLRDAYFVPETKPLRTLLHEFQSQKLHVAILLDEYGGTAGIVTLEDILEELVGEIADEYEKPEPEAIKKIDADIIEVDARTYVDDLNDNFELSLPEDEDYDMIGGFVFSYLGYIPKTGVSFNYENLKFTITSAEARKIKRIRIQKTSRRQNAD